MDFPDKWFACQQTPYDRVRFVEYSNPEEINSLEYYKFLDYTQKQIRVRNFTEFRSSLDRFKKLLIDLDTGDWQEYIEDSPESASFEELLSINTPSEEESQSRGEKLVSMVLERKYRNKKFFGIFG